MHSFIKMSLQNLPSFKALEFIAVFITQHFLEARLQIFYF